MSYKLYIPILSIVSLAFLGCSDSTRSEYSQAGDLAKDAVKKDVAKGEKAADAASDAATKSLADDQSKAIQKGKDLLDSTMTPKIKSALATAKDLHSSDIEVKTQGKKIFLSGSVPSAEEKKRAASISTDIAGPDFKVVNQLTVAKG